MAHADLPRMVGHDRAMAVNVERPDGRTKSLPRTMALKAALALVRAAWAFLSWLDNDRGRLRTIAVIATGIALMVLGRWLQS